MQFIRHRKKNCMCKQCSYKTFAADMNSFPLLLLLKPVAWFELWSHKSHRDSKFHSHKKNLTFNIAKRCRLYTHNRKETNISLSGITCDKLHTEGIPPIIYLNSLHSTSFYLMRSFYRTFFQTLCILYRTTWKVNTKYLASFMNVIRSRLVVG